MREVPLYSRGEGSNVQGPRSISVSETGRISSVPNTVDGAAQSVCANDLGSMSPKSMSLKYP